MKNTFSQSSAPSRAPSRAIRLARVCELTGASRATVWRWSKTNAAFPRPFKLSAGITGWDEAEILGWLEAKKSTRAAA